MSEKTTPFSPLRWLINQPHLLLSLTSLFWAGNIVLARFVAGHVPPMTLSCVRWIGAFILLWPFAKEHLRKDWPTLRANLPLMLLLSATGFAFNNAISYLALQYTEALNALLIQSSAPLFVALWALLLFGVRLTWAQLGGIVISLAGVLTIILRGDASALAAIHFNKGDLMFASAVLAFGLYSAVMTRRPSTHPLSLITFTMACGSLITELALGRSLMEAKAISKLMIERQIGGLPEASGHAAQLASDALKALLEKMKLND